MFGDSSAICKDGGSLVEIQQPCSRSVEIVGVFQNDCELGFRNDFKRLVDIRNPCSDSAETDEGQYTFSNTPSSSKDAKMIKSQQTFNNARLSSPGTVSQVNVQKRHLVASTRRDTSVNASRRLGKTVGGDSTFCNSRSNSDKNVEGQQTFSNPHLFNDC